MADMLVHAGVIFVGEVLFGVVVLDVLIAASHVRCVLVGLLLKSLMQTGRFDAAIDGDVGAIDADTKLRGSVNWVTVTPVDVEPVDH